MKIINLSQTNNTDAWLQERTGRITGTKSGSLALDHYQQTDTKKIIKHRDKALEQAKKATSKDEIEEHFRTALKYDELLTEADAKNKRLKVGIDFWKFLAETMAEQPNGENPMERGHRLEPENIHLTLKQLGYEEKDCVTDCGIWESDEDDRIACSPDAYQASENPTWAIECKSLGSAYHLQAAIPWMVHSQRIRQREIPENLADAAAQVLPATATSLKATNMDFIPDAYKSQVLQYFVVCDTLETLYFSMYDPRVYGDARHQVIPINRESIQPLIAEHKHKQLNILHIIDTLTEATGASFK